MCFFFFLFQDENPQLRTKRKINETTAEEDGLDEGRGNVGIRKKTDRVRGHRVYECVFLRVKGQSSGNAGLR